MKPAGFAHSVLFLFLLTPTLLPAQDFWHQTNGPNRKGWSEKQSLHKGAGSPRYGLININNLTTWARSDGQSNHSPAGDNGMYFPKGTGNVIYKDGIVFGGKVYVGGFPGSGGTPASLQPIRVGGGTYGVGTKEGWITGLGATAIAVSPGDARARVYRIRRDYASMSIDEARSDAQHYYELARVTEVTDALIAAVIAQYDKDWKEWPVDLGAPYIDRNKNGRYDSPPPFSVTFTYSSLISQNLDEPGVAGADPNSPADQVIWTVYNDLDRTQALNFTGSEPLGLEIQKTGWAYKRTDVLGNVYFSKYKIINKGGIDIGGGQKGAFYIDSMYVCQWSDPDLGNFSDDLVGCDSLLNLVFVYNLSDIDSTFLRFAIAPPSVGYVFLAGPIVPSSPGDSAVFDLKTRRGFKNLGMSSFAYFAAGSPYSDPWGGPASYSFGTGRWWKLLRGFAPLGSITDPDQQYAFPPGAPTTKFPLSGDPVGGTGFLDGLGTSYSFWPGDRRILLNTGPFRMAPGDTQEITVGVVGGLGADRLLSIAVMKSSIRSVQNTFNRLFQGLTPLPSFPTLASPANGATDQPTTLTLIWNPSSGASTYRIQVSTSSAFTPLVIDDQTVTTTTRQIGPLANNTTYYWRVSAKNAVGSSAFSSPHFSFTTLGSKTVLPSSPIVFPANPTSSTDYRLVSFPGVSSLSVSQVLSGGQNTDWRIFRENGSAIPNNLSELSSSSSLSVGEGYWLLKKGTFNFSQTVTMPQVSSDGTYTISVRNGWNLIGNPFDVDVPWSAVLSANGLLNITLSTYNGSQGFQSATVLEPFKAYYCNLPVASLKIPYPFPNFKVSPSEPAPQIDWQVQLILHTEINTDAQNHLGIAPSAKLDLDELDQPKPPLVFDQGFLYFSRPSWDSRYGIFNSDFRPSLGDGQIWDFEVSNPRISACRIRFNDIEKIPSEYDVILLNDRSTTRVDLRERSTHEFQPVAEKTPFRLLVGKKPFVEEQMRLLVPKEFELTQNYPNPFNPSTAITYKVARDAVVRLEVLSVLGQRVAILAEGRHPPGVYTVTWNASDGTHGNTSSGVYFCRLCVDGKPTRTIRMTLLR